MANRWGNSVNSGWLFFWAPKSLQMETAAMKLKDSCSLEGKHDQPRQHIKNQRYYFADKDPYNQSYGFPSSHVWIWVSDHKASWALKNWCFWTVVLDKTLESPLDCKEIKPINSKENESWTFIGRTDAKAEAPILWPPKNWLIGKDLMLGNIEGRRRGNRGWDGQMASPTQLTWVWASSRSAGSRPAQGPKRPWESLERGYSLSRHPMIK